MEIDDIRTNISSENQSFNNFNPPKFAVHRNQVCLRTSPPSDKIKSRIPFLKDFNIKFTKRENIDKKLVRKFRKYLKTFFNINLNNGEDSDFWTCFINEELYPPVKFRCAEDNRVYEFKSFNTNYMAWVFTRKRASFYYSQFVKEKAEEVFGSIVKKNQRAIGAFSDEERNHIYNLLRYYINNVSNVFNTFSNEEMCESMTAAVPNHSGDIFEEMLEIDIKAFCNEDSFYNKK
jgi:hypothetical protein